MRTVNVFRLLWVANYFVKGSEVVSVEENTRGHQNIDKFSNKEDRKLQYGYGYDYHDYEYHYRYEVTAVPTPRPTHKPTPYPTPRPTPLPTLKPSKMPTPYPSPRPTPVPTPKPTPRPTLHPTRHPIPRPTRLPTPNPTPDPTPKPTIHPTPRPTDSPTCEPSPSPSDRPTPRPTAYPTNSEEPSESPTDSEEPSENPTDSEEPSENPTDSEEPSENPTDDDDRTIAAIICRTRTLDRLCEFIRNFPRIFNDLDDADQDFTIWAPDNSAFRIFLAFVGQNPFIRDVRVNDDNNNNVNNVIFNDNILGYDIGMGALIDYHTTRGELEDKNLSCDLNRFVRMLVGGETQTLCRSGIPFGQKGTCQDRHPGGGFPNMVEEIRASNGIIRIVDQVLLPRQSLYSFQLGCEVWGNIRNINTNDPAIVNPDADQIMNAICGKEELRTSKDFCDLIERSSANVDNPFINYGRPVTYFVPNSDVDLRNNNDKLFTNEQSAAINRVLGISNQSTEQQRRQDLQIVVQFLQLHTVENIVSINTLCGGSTRPSLNNKRQTLRDDESVTIDCNATKITVRADNNQNGDNAPRIDPGDEIAYNSRFHIINEILSSRP
mmetsp:Transcript_15702/g.36303  ORF Transcript_15702/g.36303 Transcript_15702/m.36303 type:complete len:604 (+) Transcript_15702:121-1932(+)|eukprot:CAMPEP_0197174204 /NCGR_PEP_ID=MMETSP1423-20130617/826_1 /TAXON_ID=476441 /ORGANISM="Pseudo-nitzschia heimii, Strain UNC1101" /LENGTH=603 /DNA_ID=CAMNT_0042623107 /DNA_START=71 /DNA_END=1882 /DNA_ORIENTATION=-